MKIQSYIQSFLPSLFLLTFSNHIGITKAADLTKSDFEDLGDGVCTDADGNYHDFVRFRALQPDYCFKECGLFNKDHLVGMTMGEYSADYTDCYCKYEDGTIDAAMEQAFLDSGAAQVNLHMNGKGEIVGANQNYSNYKCFKYLQAAPTTAPTTASPTTAPTTVSPTTAPTTSFEGDFEYFGDGVCVDTDGEYHDYVQFRASKPASCFEECSLFNKDHLRGITITKTEYTADYTDCFCKYDDGSIDAAMEQTFLDNGALYVNHHMTGEGEIQGTDPNFDKYYMCYKYVPSPTTAPTAEQIQLVNSNGGSAQGDPTIIGLRGQVFKFDGRHGGWYSNIASDSLKWNMEFQKYDTCPMMEDTFVSSSSFLLFDSARKDWTKILIKTTPPRGDEDLKQCERSDVACLGEGTIHISFDGGETFHSNAGDYHFGEGSRVIAHNTYAVCSRRWYDYEVANTSNPRNNLRSNRRLSANEEMSPYQYLSDKTEFMIDPVECGGWLQDRIAKNDLFEQRGMWSTIHIETPLVSFHIEYRRSNHNKFDRNCDFQSLDTWMSRVSTELNEQEWNGILGETRSPTFDDVTGEEVKSDRFKVLRGKDDSDYEVDGPFGINFNAATVQSTNKYQFHDIVTGVMDSFIRKIH